MAKTPLEYCEQTNVVKDEKKGGNREGYGDQNGKFNEIGKEQEKIKESKI